MIKFKDAMKISSLGHIIVFVLLFASMPKSCHRGGDGDSEKKKQQKHEKHKEEKNEEILDKPSQKPMEVQLIEETGEQRAKRVELSRRKAIAECEPHFGGIGIEHTVWGQVGKVYQYYPGYDAGLKPGDEIVSPMQDIKGAIGTSVTITYKRAGILNTVTVTRGRICTKDVR